MGSQSSKSAPEEGNKPVERICEKFAQQVVKPVEHYRKEEEFKSEVESIKRFCNNLKDQSLKAKANENQSETDDSVKDNPEINGEEDQEEDEVNFVDVEDVEELLNATYIKKEAQEKYHDEVEKTDEYPSITAETEVIKQEPREYTKSNEEEDAAEDVKEDKQPQLVWNPFARLKHVWRKTQAKEKCSSEVKMEPLLLHTPSTIYPVIKQESPHLDKPICASQDPLELVPCQPLDSIKAESSHVIEVSEDDEECEDEEDNKSPAELQVQPIALENAARPKPTILEKVLIVKPPTSLSPLPPTQHEKRKNDFDIDAQNRPKTRKRKRISPENNCTKERQLQQQRRKKKKICSPCKSPLKVRGRPRKNENKLAQETKRRLWIEHLFGCAQKQNPMKKVIKQRKPKYDNSYTYKYTKSPIKSKNEVITRSKRAKLELRTIVPSSTQKPHKTKNPKKTPPLSFPKPIKAEPNNYALIYPIAEVLPQPILAEKFVDKNNAKIKAELLANSGGQPQLRLRRVPMHRLTQLRSGGFFISNAVTSLLESNKHIPRDKKLKTPSIKLENAPTTVDTFAVPHLQIKSAYSLNPVVRLKRLNTLKRYNTTIQTELLEPLLPTECSACASSSLSSTESPDSPTSLSFVCKEEPAWEYDDSGISMDDSDGQSGRLSMAQNHVLSVALDEALIMEIATQRAHINNCLIKFGYSPVQFRLYNSLEELQVFLDYLLIE